MKALAVLSALLLAAAASRADFVITQRVEGQMQQGTMTIKIKDAKARADIAPQMSTITDGATGDVITLMHSMRQFMKIPAERAKALMEQMQKLQGAQAGEPPKLVPSGKKEKIENNDCEVFTWNAQGVTATYWVAKDYPNAAAISAALDKLQSNGVGSLSRGLTPKPSDFPGMVVKSEMVVGGQKVTTTLVSVVEQPVDANQFVVPAGYKEMPMPAFPGAN